MLLYRVILYYIRLNYYYNMRYIFYITRVASEYITLHYITLYYNVILLHYKRRPLRNAHQRSGLARPGLEFVANLGRAAKIGFATHSECAKTSACFWSLVCGNFGFLLPLRMGRERAPNGENRFFF